MSTTAPNTMKALKIQGPAKVVLAESCPVPQPRDDEILVRVVCVTLNPVDWKSADLSPTVGATWGIDFSGEVVKVGSAVKRPFAPGECVCGGVFGNNPDEPKNGAFAEYVVVPGDLVLKIPRGMSFEKAATLGIGLSTVGLALYQSLKLPLPGSPTSKSRFVLVYGGGTATGTLAIQLLRMSGMQPVTTCSPHNFRQVKALGAIEAFDYHSPSCVSDILAYTKNSLELVLDCITNSGSMKICYSAIGPKGGRYIALDPFPIRGHTRRSIKPSWILTFTITGKPVNWQEPFRRDARPQDREFAERWYQVAQQLLDEGSILTHPIEEAPGGLAGIIRGADRGRKGLLSGIKLVYRIRDGN